MFFYQRHSPGDGISWVFGGDDVIVRPAVNRERPGIQADDRDAALQGVAYFRQRAVTAVNGDNSLRGLDYCHVSGITDAGNDRYLNVGISVLAVVPRQYADSETALSGGTPAGGFHDAPQPPADQDGTLAGNLLPDLFSQFGYLRGNLAAANYADKNEFIFHRGIPLLDILIISPENKLKQKRLPGWHTCDIIVTLERLL
jgi:hypothetical protein